MKILCITSKPTFPIVDGGCFASAQFLKNLVNIGAIVDVYTVCTKKHPFDKSNYPLDLGLNNIFSDFFDTSIKTAGILKSFITNKSYHISRFNPTGNEQDLNSINCDNYDLIIADGLYAMPIAASFDNINKPIILRSHNVEYKIWEDQLHNSKGLRKIVLKRMIKQLKNEEQQLLSTANHILSISDVDTIFLKKHNTKTTLIPVSLSVSDIELSYENNELFHIGSRNWEPNYKAVDRLVQCVRNINKNSIRVQLYIAGSGWNKEFEDKNIGINEVGFVNSIADFAQDKGVLVTPITEGSGIRIKILEMLALGIPVITTPKGAEGIHAPEAMVIAENNREIETAILNIISSQPMRKTMGLAGKQYIRANHSFERVESILKSVFENI